MNIIKKLSLATATAFTLGLAANASAAVIVTDSDGSDPDTLSSTSDVSIRNNTVVANGALVAEDNDGSFFVDPDTGNVFLTFDLNDSTGEPVGIADFTVEFFTDAAMTNTVAGPFVLSGPDGAEEPLPMEGLLLSLPAGEVFFQVSGIGQSESPGFTADYNIRLQADAIPVPAAGLLFLTAVAGAGAARSRKKVA